MLCSQDDEGEILTGTVTAAAETSDSEAPGSPTDAVLKMEQQIKDLDEEELAEVLSSQKPQSDTAR